MFSSVNKFAKLVKSVDSTKVISIPSQILPVYEAFLSDSRLSSGRDCGARVRLHQAGTSGGCCQ